MTLDEVLGLLEGVRPSGNGYVALCPSHEDGEPSMGVTEADGKILLNCYAGCAFETIVAALGKEPRDFFVRSKQKLDLGDPESIYVYTDEHGNELFQALRYRTGEGKKTFRQRHRDPSNEVADEDGWVWSMDDVRRVPYGLPALLAAARAGQSIYVTEGEKDAEALRRAGRVATCNPMGAGKWRPEFAEYFRGSPCVIVVADRDEPGRNHAQAIKTSLEGVVPAVWVVEAKEGKDAYDHLEAGWRVEDFKIIRKQKRGIVTTKELAVHARERLDMTEADIPGYLLCPPIPVVMRQGRMYAVGAYTGEGKTCIAQQGYRTLSQMGKRVGYFSLEMPEIDLVNRLVAHRGVPLRYTEQPWKLKGDPAMLALYEEAVEEIAGWNSDIIFDSGVSADSIRETTMDREYEAIFVDHLHRFAFGERKTLEAEVKKLTNIALELNVLVVILCQLRKYERGRGFTTYPKPTLQDFRETSQIGDDASMALAVWRQRDEAGATYTGATEVIVLKNRHTTGPQDAAGQSWFPYFDVDRQMFTSGPIAAPQPQEGW